MTAQLFGVNIGGWLVSEPWMTPWLYKGTQATCEYELSNTASGRERLRAHHAEYIKEEDFRWLSEQGVQLLRIPVGYWVLGDSTQYVEAADRLDWAFQMAEKYQLQILLSFHGAPGSQNGREHSGKIGHVEWYSWSNLWTSYRILLKLARRYHRSQVLWGIQLLNEPIATTKYQKYRLWLWSWWMILRLKHVIAAGTRIVISDCYDLGFWRHRLRNAVLDVHHYQCFSPGLHDGTLDQQCDAAAGSREVYDSISSRRPFIIGEWSATLPSKARATSRIARKRYIEAQLEAFHNAEAVIFWSYKSAEDDTWNFRHLVESRALQLPHRPV